MAWVLFRCRGMDGRAALWRATVVAGAIEAMEQRRLGRTDIVASVLGFGGSEIGYQRVGARTVSRLFRSALDAGLNVIDTAECYEDSEVLIGRKIGARRRETASFDIDRTPVAGAGLPLMGSRSRRLRSGPRRVRCSG